MSNSVLYFGQMSYIKSISNLIYFFKFYSIFLELFLFIFVLNFVSIIYLWSFMSLGDFGRNRLIKSADVNVKVAIVFHCC